MKIQEIIEIIEIIEKLETRNNSYWNFYTIVIIAVCGWVISQKTGDISPNTAIALMVGNGLFYFMNLSVIYATTSRIVAFEKELIHEPLVQRTFRQRCKSIYLNRYSNIA